MNDEVSFYLLYCFNTTHIPFFDGNDDGAQGRTYRDLVDKSFRPSTEVISQTEWEYASLLASLDHVPDDLLNTLNSSAIYLYNYISDILDNAAYQYQQRARLERYTIIQNPDHPDYIIISDQEYSHIQPLDEEDMEYLIYDFFASAEDNTGEWTI
jgi:hypothetical protein